MAKKLHVEIGINGEKSVGIVGGSGAELIAAACFALNVFTERLRKIARVPQEPLSASCRNM